MAQVFISHVTEEAPLAGAVERCIKDVFEPKPPSIFLSSNTFTMVGGERFEDRIVNEIRECTAFIVMCSDRSFAKSWVHVESGAAWALGKGIIPVCYGGRAKGTLPRPYFSFHAVDLEEPYNLVLAVGKHIGGEHALVPPPPGLHLSGDKYECGIWNTGPYDALLEELRRVYPKGSGKNRAQGFAPAVDSRLRKLQELLFEIVSTAKETAQATDDFERLTSQAWLVTQIRAFVTRCMGVRQYMNFENFLEVRQKKKEQAGDRMDSKSTLLAIAEYFEKVIPELAMGDVEEDLDEKAKLPDSFQGFMNES